MHAIVRCFDCVTDHGGPKQWKWFCEECAVNCQDTHRRDTGHRPELTLVPEPTMESLRHQIKKVSWGSW